MSESSFEEEPTVEKLPESLTAASVLGSDDHGGEDTSNSDDKIVAREDNQAVRRSKAVVLIVIGLTALAFGIATYFFASNEEQSSFELQFKDYASKILSVANAEARSSFGLIGNMAITITSYAIDSGSQWPFVKVPHFEQRGTANNDLSKALQLSVVPIVKKDLKDQWEMFASQNQSWVQAGVSVSHPGVVVPPIPTSVFTFQNGNTSGTTVPQDGPGIDYGYGNYGVVWQQAPAPSDPKIINYDLLSHPAFAKSYEGAWETMSPVLSDSFDLGFLYGGAVQDNQEHPHSFLMQPVYANIIAQENQRDDLVALVVAVIPWDTYFQNLLPEGVGDVTLVLESSCGPAFTYRLSGAVADYVGDGDLHDTSYNDLRVHARFAPFLNDTFSNGTYNCDFVLAIYPTRTLEDNYKSNKPWVYAIVVVAVFMFTAAVFMGYDYLVQRRNTNVVTKAKRTNAIVKSLFPANVRDRILADADLNDEELRAERKGGKFNIANKDKLKTFLDEEEGHVSQPYGSKPIADLFPSATVMFADIVGFTAWSSVREPTQVFTLLETIYHAFDELAKNRRVFKVETIGDCYVAVCGLPDPRPDHAIVMARFSRECLAKMNILTKKLEVQLGPDTGDLTLRIGMHTGPVTAGVLRGDKSRFQLFGDTVNTAARVESSGERNKIHISEETANMLIKAGKTHWIKQRTDIVAAKGKGAMETFWLDTSLKSTTSVRSGEGKDTKTTAEEKNAAAIQRPIDLKANLAKEDEKHTRLIGWNADVLGRLLKQIIVRRDAAVKIGKTVIKPKEIAKLPPRQPGSMVLDEVREIIHLPEFDAVVVEQQEEPSSITLDEDITQRLRDLVAMIASIYRDNPFHNFEHASHVTMSVVKLLSRITTADSLEKQNRDASTLHDFTYGITSDPLTQFACVWAALIHDVDHAGVPNTQLINENTKLAETYRNKSVAEQNSVDMSWDLFMDAEFTSLRRLICATTDELVRFRELVVNAVMATDIMDKDLKALRNARWEKAFSEGATEDSAEDAVNRKATIVIEHLIQASDVAHTMQHWHIYRKWNERLFHEMYLAYREGRAEKDPTEFWYKGEMGFFDFYIIPLAKKLKDCGVFGVSSDEYLNYAEKNRREWESKGQGVLEKMVESHKKEYPLPEPEDTDKVSMKHYGAEKAAASTADDIKLAQNEPLNFTFQKPEKVGL